MLCDHLAQKFQEVWHCQFKFCALSTQYDCDVLMVASPQEQPPFSVDWLQSPHTAAIKTAQFLYTGFSNILGRVLSGPA